MPKKSCISCIVSANGCDAASSSAEKEDPVEAAGEGLMPRRAAAAKRPATVACEKGA